MLQACLNGGRAKAEHRAIPCAPDELAADARAASALGAAEFHVHPRGADGLESLAPDDVAAALQAIRASAPSAPIGLSTGAWIRPGGRARQEAIRSWTVLPDYVSVNLVEEDAPEVIALAMEKGFGVEAGLWTVADARRFAALPTAAQCLRALIEINGQDVDEGLRVAHAIIAALDEARLVLPRLLHGLDATKWPLYRESLRLGLDGRIGFEDGLRLPSGEIAASNAALIAAARALAS
ncbi:MAG: 3-keto-5-aminohexanoate cleavage protein [Roseiarcus sp.]|jgi:uncharacterized protein (DUF849 family)